MAFAITEPDAGSNSHRITTTARRDAPTDPGRPGRCSSRESTRRRRFSSSAALRDHKTGNLKPALFVVPTDTPGCPGPRSRWRSSARSRSSRSISTMSGCPPTHSRRLGGRGHRAVVRRAQSRTHHGFRQCGRPWPLALGKAADYVRTRQVWKTPIGAHQGLSHPWRPSTSRSNWPS